MRNHLDKKRVLRSAWTANRLMGRLRVPCGKNLMPHACSRNPETGETFASVPGRSSYEISHRSLVEITRSRRSPTSSGETVGERHVAVAIGRLGFTGA